MAYPEHLLTDDEIVLRDFHPHWRVLLSAGAWTILAIAVITAVTQLTDSGTARLAVIAVTLLVWLVFAGGAVIRWRFTEYVLTTERLVVRGGVLSRSGTEIPLENINDVRFSQRLFERILGYGDVMIESAGEQGQSTLSDIPEPEQFQSEVYRAREERSLHLGGGGGGPRDAVAQLEALARLHEQGAITDDEFAAKKARLLDQI